MQQENEVSESVIEALTNEFGRRIIGKKWTAYSCHCGAIKVGESEVVSIVAPTSRKIRDIKLIWHWTFKVREIGKTEDCPWKEVLSYLIKKEEFLKIIQEHLCEAPE